jgi:multidrug resistance efflux pump
MRAAAIALVLALGLAACGGGDSSKEDKASSQVCDARADIEKQVNTLKNLTISTATTDQITKSLQAIGDDLTKIKDARGDLSSDRKQEVEQANKDFESSVKGIASDLGTSTSLSDAKTKLSSALDDLATSYQQTFAKINC